jgi:hypothetical protein
LSITRTAHRAALLPDGRVLVAGGFSTNSTELFGSDPGLAPVTQAEIAAIPPEIALGDPLALTGSNFRGVSGGSSGNTQDSSTDYPLLQLHSIESGQTRFLLATNWSATSFTSLPVWNFPPGYALATVFVNGIQSPSSIVNISVPIPTPPRLTDPTKLPNGSFQFTFTNSVGALFAALASTNLALPLSNWTALGGAVEFSPGQFRFTDTQSTNFPGRFYGIRAP